MPPPTSSNTKFLMSSETCGPNYKKGPGYQYVINYFSRLAIAIGKRCKAAALRPSLIFPNPTDPESAIRPRRLCVTPKKSTIETSKQGRLTDERTYPTLCLLNMACRANTNTIELRSPKRSTGSRYADIGGDCSGSGRRALVFRCHFVLGSSR